MSRCAICGSVDDDMECDSCHGNDYERGKAEAQAEVERLTRERDMYRAPAEAMTELLAGWPAAKNYVEMKAEWGGVHSVITVRRLEGKTTHELRDEDEAMATRLRERNRALREALASVLEEHEGEHTGALETARALLAQEDEGT